MISLFFTIFKLLFKDFKFVFEVLYYYSKNNLEFIKWIFVFLHLIILTFIQIIFLILQVEFKFIQEFYFFISACRLIFIPLESCFQFIILVKLLPGLLLF